MKIFVCKPAARTSGSRCKPKLLVKQQIDIFDFADHDK